MTSVLSHAHVFSILNKDTYSTSQMESIEKRTDSGQADKCADSAVHFCGCVHFVVLKSIDLRISSKIVSNKDYPRIADQFVQQEFYKKLKRPPKV